MSAIHGLKRLRPVHEQRAADDELEAEVAIQRRKREEFSTAFRHLETPADRQERERDESEALWYANMCHERPTSAWPIANAEAWFRQEAKAKQAAVQAQWDAQSDRACAIRALEQKRKDAEKRRLAEEAKLRPLDVKRPENAKGPPCPWADIPAGNLTEDQRYSVTYWDFPSSGWREKARAYAQAHAVQALAPGELLPETVEDIARYCSELVADEYANAHAHALRCMYERSAGAKFTKGANDAAWLAAFTAGGLVPDASGRYQVREADEDGALAFASGDEVEDEAGDEWIVPGLIPAGCQMVLVGDQASGKTTLAASLLAAVAVGRTWLGRATSKCQSAVVNFDGRDTDLRQLLREAGANGKVGVLSYPEHNLTSDRFWTALERRYGNGVPALIVIDSLSRGSGGEINETDARFATPVLRAAELSARYPITFVWLHHTPVTVRGNGINDWLRGTSALGAAFDIGFGLTKVSSTASPRATVIRVETLKMRPKGVTPPGPFKFRITNDGVALHDGKGAASLMSEEEKALSAIRSSPDGISASAVASQINIRKSEALVLVKVLVGKGTVVKVGTGPATKYVSVPEAIV